MRGRPVLTARGTVTGLTVGAMLWVMFAASDLQAEESVFAERQIGSRKQSILLSVVFPGMGQLSMGRKITGSVLVIAELSSLATALTANENYKTRLDNFKLQKSEYEQMSAGGSQFDAAEARWQQLQKDANRLDNIGRTRRVFTAAAVGIYVYSLADILLFDGAKITADDGWRLRALPAMQGAPARLVIASRF